MARLAFAIGSYSSPVAPAGSLRDRCGGRKRARSSPCWTSTARRRDAGAELGGGSLGLGVDVTDLDGLGGSGRGGGERLGGIDVLVANAGIGPWTTTVGSGDRHHQRRVLDVNLHGVWHTMWAAADRVVERQGHIVVISSIAAFVLTPGWAAYAASKAAVEQLARSMRRGNSRRPEPRRCGAFRAGRHRAGAAVRGRPISVRWSGWRRPAVSSTVTRSPPQRR